MAKAYESGYYHTAYEVQKGFNVGWDIAAVNQGEIEKVISKPWASDGYNFSERIWNSKEKLIQTVHNELTQSIMLGKDPQKAIDSIAKIMETSKNNAGRLVMTEQAYFFSAAQRDCFRELGVEEYEIVATLDSHTSGICQSLDGQHFPIKDFQAGVSAPPFHPWCRSTTAPYFPENFGQIGERAAKDEDGTTYYVPDDMKYKDWKETFVDGGKSGFAVIKDAQNGLLSYAREETVIGKKAGTPMSINDALAGANPHFAEGKEYQINCQRCVQTYELRRRGFDVEALPEAQKNNIIKWGKECFADTSGRVPDFTFNQTALEIKSELASAPENSRYIIYTAWNKDVAHVFIGEKENGIVNYIDPQSREDDVQNYLSLGVDGMFGYLRVDDEKIINDPTIIKATME